MPPHRVTVRVPATSANLGPGFDCLGVALDLWGRVTVAVDDGASSASRDALSDMVFQAVRAGYSALGVAVPDALAITWSGDIPIGRGLGASAAVRAAGLLAAAALCGSELAMEKLLLLGAHLEGHADNIAPALLGGLQVVVQDGEQLVHVGLPVPAGLKVVLFVPELVMPTRESRRLLPLNLTRADAVYNIGRAALLLAAATSGQWDALGTAMQDRLHQPARSQLFPAMYPLFDAARQAGAFGAYLSGGGSTIAAWVDETGADRVAQALAEAAARMEVAGSVRIAGFSQRGGYIDSVE